MSYNINFENFTDEVIRRLHDVGVQFLEESGGEVESLTMQNSRVDTGDTKGSFEHKVSETEMVCYVGSNSQNAIWEEFGTGEYALNGNGRKDKWRYKDAKGNWYTTTGKKPSRAMYKAFQTSKHKIQRRAEELFGGVK